MQRHLLVKNTSTDFDEFFSLDKKSAKLKIHRQKK